MVKKSRTFKKKNLKNSRWTKKTFNNNISTWFIEKDCTFIILDKEKKGYQNFRWGDFGETKQKTKLMKI